MDLIYLILFFFPRNLYFVPVLVLVAFLGVSFDL